MIKSFRDLASPTAMRLYHAMLCAGVAIMAASALAGWALDIDRLKVSVSGSTTIKANAAVALFALAVGLSPGRPGLVRRWARAACGATGIAIGAATLAEYFAGLRLGIDEALFADPATTSAPFNGRMSPATAIGLVTVGTAIILLQGGGRFRVAAAHALALPAAAMGLLSLTGYVYGVERLYNFGPYVSVAITTAAALCALAAVTLLTRADEGWGRVLKESPLARGVLARLLPPLFALPFVTGLVVLGGVRAGWYDALFGIAILAMLSGLGLGWLAMAIAAKVERALALSDANFRLLAENARDMISWVGPDGQRRYVSPASAHIFGVPPDALVSQGPLSMIHPGDAAAVTALQSGLLSGVIAEGDATFRVLHPTRGEVWVEANARSLPGSTASTPAGYISVLRDVTERVRLEADQEARGRELLAANAELKQMADHLVKARDAADRASQAKSRFLAGMNHEMRTPLHGLLGYGQLLRLDGELNDIQVARFDAMMGAGAHLLEMINSVLDLSQIEAEHVELLPIETDLPAIAATCLDLVRPKAEAKGLVLRLETAPGAPRRLLTDPMRLRQVLLNLLSNAVKFTEHGTVAMRLCPVAGRAALRVEVSDTGPGIEAHLHPRLFQEFDRLGADAAHIEGAGLGLALSARLAALLGGSIGHDANPGGGSLFWLELPLTLAATNPSAAAPAPVPIPVAGRPLRVLVADDVAMNREIACAFLRAAGHATICAADGAEAVAAVIASDLDVVLMDVRMPKVDGLEATRRIRALGGAAALVPIIGLTAQGFTEQVLACTQAGMDAHLAKPYTPEALLAAVARAAASPHQGAAVQDAA